MPTRIRTGAAGLRTQRATLAMLLSMGLAQAQSPAPESGDTEPALFRTLVGAWATEGDAWLHGHGQPPIRDRGHALVSRVNAGKALLLEACGTQGGEPIAALQLLAYDAAHASYRSVWSDSTSGDLFVSEAAGDGESRDLLFDGLSRDPHTGRRDKHWHYRIRLLDGDTLEMDYLDPALPEAERVVFSSRYRRLADSGPAHACRQTGAAPAGRAP